MTVNELYKMSSLLIFETPDYDEDLKDSFPAILNRVLAEMVDYENQFRRLEKMPLLKVEDIPFYTSADDTRELPICEKLCRSVLPLAIKSGLLEEDGGKQAEAVLAYNMYAAGMMDMTPAVFEEVSAGGAE